MAANNDARPLPGLPPLLERRQRKLMIFAACLLLVIFIAAVAGWLDPGSALLTLFLIWVVLSLFNHYAFRFRLRRHAYKLCVECGYDLRGQDPQDRCPECGREFDIDQVQRAWREYLSLRRL